MAIGKFKIYADIFTLESCSNWIYNSAVSFQPPFKKCFYLTLHKGKIKAFSQPTERENESSTPFNSCV